DVVYEVNDKVNWAGVNILDRDAEETTEAIPSSVHLDFTLARVIVNSFLRFLVVKIALVTLLCS
ncbi:MAG: hypothetical protein WBH69_09155, partial [Fervidobacterium sp.]